MFSREAKSARHLVAPRRCSAWRPRLRACNDAPDLASSTCAKPTHAGANTLFTRRRSGRGGEDRHRSLQTRAKPSKDLRAVLDEVETTAVAPGPFRARHAAGAGARTQLLSASRRHDASLLRGSRQMRGVCFAIGEPAAAGLLTCAGQRATASQRGAHALNVARVALEVFARSAWASGLCRHGLRWVARSVESAASPWKPCTLAAQLLGVQRPDRFVSMMFRRSGSSER